MTIETRTQEEKVIERVRKLLALAGSSNEHEAAAAAAKAQELLLKYNLSTASVEGETPTEEAVQKVFTDHDNYSMGWRSTLLSAICAATSCKMVQQKSYQHAFAKRFWIFGKESNVEVAYYLYEYLVKELLRVGPKPSNTPYAHAWRMGACVSVHQKLMATFVEFRDASPTTIALVVVNDSAALALRDKTFPKLSKSRSGRISDSEGYFQGRADGKNIPIHRGVGSSQRNAGGQVLLG
jgi:hypothetical protein